MVGHVSNYEIHNTQLNIYIGQIDIREYFNTIDT